MPTNTYEIDQRTNGPGNIVVERKMAVKYDKLTYRFVVDPQLRPRYDLQQFFDRPITACTLHDLALISRISSS